MSFKGLVILGLGCLCRVGVRGKAELGKQGVGGGGGEVHGFERVVDGVVTRVLGCALGAVF